MTVICPPTIDLRPPRVDVAGMQGDPLAWRIDLEDPVGFAMLDVRTTDGALVWSNEMWLDGSTWVAYVPGLVSLDGPLGGKFYWWSLRSEVGDVVGGALRFTPLGLNVHDHGDWVAAADGVSVSPGTFADIAIGAMLQPTSWDGWWDAESGTLTTLPNGGRAGAALNATVAGLIRVEGPAVWMPYNGNVLRAPIGAVATPVGDVETVFRWRTNWDVLQSTHMFAFTTTSNYWTVTYFGGTLYVSLRTGGVAYSNNASVNLTTRTGVVDGATVSVRVRRASSTGVITMDYRLDDSTPWLSLPVTQASPVPGVLDSWAPVRMEQLIHNSAAGGLISDYEVTRDGFDGPVLFEYRRTDVADAAPDAAAFTSTSGHAISVTRGSVGPVLTIVPEGVEYVNPDPTNINNRVLMATTPAPLGFTAAEDAVQVWVGRLGTLPALFTQIMLMASGGPDSSQMTLYNGNSIQVVRAAAYDTAGDQAIVQMTPTGTLAYGLRRMMLVNTIDRAAGLLRGRAYLDTGMIANYTASIANVGDLLNDYLYSMSNLPGSLKFMAFRKGVGVALTDAQLDVLADRLLSGA